MKKFKDVLEQVYKHLESDVQNWLFGAGISYESKVPLMIPLTRKVKADLIEEHPEEHKTYDALERGLFESAHIEHILSHIGDLLALLNRSQKEKLIIDNYTYTVTGLEELYNTIIKLISKTIRYGYYPSETDSDQDEIGTRDRPIVTIEHHQRFVQELFSGQSNLQNRRRINFFTTNYDTLLEDALAIEKKEVIDGFTGGAIGYWNPSEYDSGEFNKYHVYKLHGSIDWYKDSDGALFRSRYGSTYLSDKSNVLIYPQSTKYVETQKDPFASLFKSFREKMKEGNNNILAVCGYSFGDDHINSEIESSLFEPNNNTTLLVFTKELRADEDNKTSLPPILEVWNKNDLLNKRIFILTDKGIYNGGNFFNEREGDEYNWWSFGGLTNLIAGEVKVNAV